MHFPNRVSRRLMDEAKRYIPNGVNSNFRYWGDETMVIARGQGAHLWDVDGNRYIDYRLGFGPIILGHAHPAVNRRVAEAIEGGTTFAATTPLEIELAARLTRLTGMESVRLANSGTEATMHALRLARAYTGRERFIKFEGQYHGHADYFMFSTPSIPVDLLGCAVSPLAVPATGGIPAAIADYVISLPYNNFEMLEAAFRAQGEEIAAVVVEPMMGNVAGILPLPGWLETIRALCDEYGAVLIFDEVKTGFRLARGGAQEFFGVRADLAAYAKAMGNGFPVAAIAGRRAIMNLAATGQVAHGGTYCGNTVATAAAVATLELLETEPVLETIFARGQTLMEGIHSILKCAGIAHVVTGVPSMFSLLIGSEEPPLDYRSYCRDSDLALYESLSAGLRSRGILNDSDPGEPWFLCYAHSAEDVAQTLTAFEEVVHQTVYGLLLGNAMPVAA